MPVVYVCLVGLGMTVSSCTLIWGVISTLRFPATTTTTTNYYYYYYYYYYSFFNNNNNYNPYSAMSGTDPLCKGTRSTGMVK